MLYSSFFMEPWINIELNLKNTTQFHLVNSILSYKQKKSKTFKLLIGFLRINS